MDAVIDRIFRAVEMTFIAALVGVLAQAVNSSQLSWFSITMLAAAGLYLGIPFGRWCPVRGATFPMRVTLTLLASSAFVTFTVPIWTLIRSTVQIDLDQARRDQAKLDLNNRQYSCARALIPWEKCPLNNQRNEQAPTQ